MIIWICKKFSEISFRDVRVFFFHRHKQSKVTEARNIFPRGKSILKHEKHSLFFFRAEWDENSQLEFGQALPPIFAASKCVHIRRKHKRVQGIINPLAPFIKIEEHILHSRLAALLPELPSANRARFLLFLLSVISTERTCLVSVSKSAPNSRNSQVTRQQIRKGLSIRIRTPMTLHWINFTFA